ncbi:hypothetical protein [Mycoplasmopsis primatum]|uniref:hypothetical protein n=1 Tax=Mycoplasmopsis primatum TaxID=55604 RepID=UPI0004962DB5|nr:hypothetical protein [Mycoplasmopsis primatum]
MINKRKLLTLIPAVTSVVVPTSIISAGCNKKRDIIDSLKLEFKTPHLFTKKEIIDSGISNFKNYVIQNHKNDYTLEFLEFVKSPNKTAQERKTLTVRFNILKNNKIISKGSTWYDDKLKDYEDNWTVEELEQLYNSIDNKNSWVTIANKNVLPSQAELTVNNLLSHKQPKINVSIVERSNDDSNGKITYKLLIASEKGSAKFVVNKLFNLEGFQSNQHEIEKSKDLEKLNKIAKELTADDLLISNKEYWLPSKYEGGIVLAENSAFKSKNPSLIPIFKITDFDDQKGTIEITYTIQDLKKPGIISNRQKLLISGFMSTENLDNLVNKITLKDLDITVNSELLPSRYNTEIKLKPDSEILKSNPNIRASVRKTDDDNLGSASLEIKLEDKLNMTVSSNYVTLNVDGFYSINQFENLTEGLSVDDIDATIDANKLPYIPKDLKIKTNSQLLSKNKNINIIVENVTLNEDDGFMTGDFKLVDTLNNITTNSFKNLKIDGFFSKNKLMALLNKLTADDIDIQPDINQNPYLPDNIKLKESSSILSENGNLVLKISNVRIDAGDGKVGFDASLYDSLNDITTNSSVYKEIVGFFSTNRFNELAKQIRYENLAFDLDKSNLPHYYRVKNLKISDSSIALLTNHPKSKIKLVSGNVSKNAKLEYQITNEATGYTSKTIQLDIYKQVLNKDINDLTQNLSVNNFVLNGWSKGTKLAENYKNGDLIFTNEIRNKYPNIRLTSKFIRKNTQNNDYTADIKFTLKNTDYNIETSKTISVSYFFSPNKFETDVKKIVVDELKFSENSQDYGGYDFISWNLNNKPWVLIHYPYAKINITSKQHQTIRDGFGFRYRHMFAIGLEVIDQTSQYTSKTKIGMSFEFKLRGDDLTFLNKPISDLKINQFIIQ